MVYPAERKGREEGETRERKTIGVMKQVVSMAFKIACTRDK
jgi:hypothetical protein